MSELNANPTCPNGCCKYIKGLFGEGENLGIVSAWWYSVQCVSCGGRTSVLVAFCPEHGDKLNSDGSIG